MKAVTLSLMSLVMMVVLAACSSKGVEVQGTLTRQDFGTASSDFATDVAAPKGGASPGVGAVIVGDTAGSLNGPNLGSDDAFIRRYNDGVGWASQFGTRNFDSATNVTVTSTGISYVAGDTQGALRFKVGRQDVFLRKYDASGVLQWTRQFGTTGTDYAKDVTLDSSGNIYVLSLDSGTSFRIRKFNTSGNLLLTITNAEAAVTAASALGVDSTGNLFVLTRYVESPNVFGRIYKYNSAGTLLKAVIFSGNNIFPYDLVIDSNNNLTYSVYDSEVASYGGGFVIRVDNALTQFLWKKSIEPAPNIQVSTPLALALDSKNDVYVTGYTVGTYSGFTNAGGPDIFVLKLASATGNRLWTRQFGGNDNDFGYGIAVSDAVYVSGYSYSNPNLVGDTNYCNCFGADAFLAQLNPANGSVLGIDQ
jgi:Beta-propeller repeat